MPSIEFLEAFDPDMILKILAGWILIIMGLSCLGFCLCRWCCKKIKGLFHG